MPGEWMWCLVRSRDDKKQLVYCTLDNEPVNEYDGKVKLGSELAVSYDKVREHKTQSSSQNDEHARLPMNADVMAHHEAGHAVAALVLGIPFIEVRIVPGENGKIGVDFKVIPWTSSPRNKARRVHRPRVGGSLGG